MSDVLHSKSVITAEARYPRDSGTTEHLVDAVLIWVGTGWSTLPTAASLGARHLNYFFKQHHSWLLPASAGDGVARERLDTTSEASVRKKEELRENIVKRQRQVWIAPMPLRTP
jgi:hypothetical protein